ncbi:hypothetical protein [Roseobacter sp. GAI101]|uniref:hypothetical protein n=1 Tax=Roseobacter sp. (strain GAI101) TaxID=391589 RepID=UPI0001871D56|nr:hypothetical protein [Roseobacter sp. GAI101]EEB84057.1 conserved hypothetical protein [Roseobacter sp. GAI101]
MLFHLKKFRATESGAVTVDWVVLCAAIVLLGVTIITSITTGTVDLADSLMKVEPGGI